MISDTRVIAWKDRMRDVMFKNFESDKELGGVVLLAKIHEEELLHHQFSIDGLHPDAGDHMIARIIDQLDPDAFIVIGQAHVVQRIASERDDMVKERDDVGSVAKMKDSKKIAVFTYETKMVSNIETYEVIEVNNDAVINKDPLMSSMDIIDNILFTGILNTDRQSTLKQILNYYDVK